MLVFIFILIVCLLLYLFIKDFRKEEEHHDIRHQIKVSNCLKEYKDRKYLPIYIVARIRSPKWWANVKV